MEIKWYKIADLAVKNFYDVPPDISGIYVVRWAKNGRPLPIGRLGGLDLKGILYIGSAKRLRRRVRQLWNGINGKGRHTIGKTIIFCKVFETINSDEYEMTWEELDTSESAEGQEWTAIHSYADKYKEPPPLNLLLKREMFGIYGIARYDKSRYVYEADEFVNSIIKVELKR